MSDPTPDLRALAQAARRGWHGNPDRWSTADRDPEQNYGPFVIGYNGEVAECASVDDARFIAAASPAVILDMYARLDEYEKVHGTEVAQVAARLAPAQAEDLCDGSGDFVREVLGVNGPYETLVAECPGCSACEINPPPAPLTTVTEDGQPVRLELVEGWRVDFTGEPHEQDDDCDNTPNWPPCPLLFAGRLVPITEDPA